MIAPVFVPYFIVVSSSEPVGDWADYAECDFTATYEFALLFARADLAVELGHDDGAGVEGDGARITPSHRCQSGLPTEPLSATARTRGP
jgi:hypothetical protein